MKKSGLANAKVIGLLGRMRKMPDRGSKKAEMFEEDEKCAKCEYWVSRGEGARTLCVYPIISGEDNKGQEMDRDGWCRNFNFND